MKKYIISLLIVGSSFIGFSNAENLSLSCNNGTCTPGTINFSQGDIINSYNDGTNGECNITVNGSFSITDNDGNEYSCTTIIFNNGRIECNGSNYPTLPYTITSNSNLNFDNYNCQNDKTPNPTFSYTPKPSGGGNEGEGGNIIQGGINAFSGIIERLGNIFKEFGPYIIYITIACLGINLLFKALKNLLGFTENKTKNSIKGR